MNIQTQIQEQAQTQTIDIKGVKEDIQSIIKVVNRILYRMDKPKCQCDICRDLGQLTV